MAQQKGTRPPELPDISLVIFDCDGVLIDSEIISAQMLVSELSKLGVQIVAIPEFAGLATSVGEIFSAALAGQKTVEKALAEAQALAVEEMTAAGYIQ